MAEHNKLGHEGEELAVKWLTENGYTILHRNWRYKQFEIDIIGLKNKFLHFIEVKARNFSPFGHPEDSVRKKKFKNLQRAADEFLSLTPVTNGSGMISLPLPCRPKESQSSSC